MNARTLFELELQVILARILTHEDAQAILAEIGYVPPPSLGYSMNFWTEVISRIEKFYIPDTRPLDSYRRLLSAARLRLEANPDLKRIEDILTQQPPPSEYLTEGDFDSGHAVEPLTTPEVLSTTTGEHVSDPIFQVDHIGSRVVVTLRDGLDVEWNHIPNFTVAEMRNHGIEPAAITELICDRVGVERLLFDIRLFQRLERAELTDAQLTNLSAIRAPIPKTLRHLNLSRNKLNDLPSVLSSLPLESLALNHNSFRSLPSILAELRALRRLEMQGNLIKQLDHGVFPSEHRHLAFIDLSGNPIGRIPDYFSRAPSCRVKLYSRDHSGRATTWWFSPDLVDGRKLKLTVDSDLFELWQGDRAVRRLLEASHPSQNGSVDTGIWLLRRVVFLLWRLRRLSRHYQPFAINSVLSPLESLFPGALTDQPRSDADSGEENHRKHEAGGLDQFSDSEILEIYRRRMRE